MNSLFWSRHSSRARNDIRSCARLARISARGAQNQLGVLRAPAVWASLAGVKSPRTRFGLVRFLVVAAFSFRLVALFPLLFAAHPLASPGGIEICAAGGGRIVPVSSQAAAISLGTAVALVADAQALLTPAQSVPAPPVAVAGAPRRIVLAFSPARAGLPYRSRAPPSLIG